MRGFAAAAFVALLVLSSGACAIVLTRDGRAAAAIVISQGAAAAKPWIPVIGKAAAPPSKVRLAAEELQRGIEKMSGARLPIVGDDAPLPKGAVVLVGASRHTQSLGLDLPRGLTPDRREEGYAIIAKGDTLVVAGNDEGPYQGTFFAVAEFLERQGVRWFMPGEFGEHVPRRATIETADFEFRDRPDFIVRAWSGNLAPSLRTDDALWRLRNKLTLDPNDILAIPGDGYLRRYLPEKALAVAHPEYFAKKPDGTLDEHMPNLSNPEVAKIVAEKVKTRIKAERATNPNFGSLGIAPDDGAPMDLSPETLRGNLGFADLGGREGVIQERSISEEWFRFMNAVMEDVAAEYPDFIITTNGYANRNTPPEGVKLHPNLGVMFAAIWADLLHSYDDPRSWQQQLHGRILQRWATLSRRVFAYNYNFPMLVTALTPMPLTRKIARNTALMKKWGVVGFEDEQTFSWMAHGITSFYLRSKLYWRATVDSRAILDDYFDKWYGPAAPSSGAFWNAIEEALESTPLLGHEDRVLPYVYSEALLDELERYQAASERAASQEPYKTRVRVDRLILDHLRNYRAMSFAEFTGDYQAAIARADSMFEEREALNRISAFVYWPESAAPRQRNFSGAYYWNLTQRREQYRKLLEMTTGKTGRLVTWAPREAMFATDPLDVGRLEQWQQPDFDRASWRKVDTAIPFYLQDNAWLDARGAPYAGFIWYVFELEVPASSVGKPIHVHAPTVVAEAWAWTNGHFSGHRDYLAAYIRPAPMDFDVSSQVKAGRNVVAVRVGTSNRMQASEGFQGPLFLYSPASP
jgi:hypothetical protein